MLDIALLPGEYAVCRLPVGAALPPALWSDLDDEQVVSVGWSGDGISLICPTERVPAGTPVETYWRCLRVVGPLDLAVTGILASLVNPLAEARVNVLVFSTYDTDHLLVPTVRLAEAQAALGRAGHRIVN